MSNDLGASPAVGSIEALIERWQKLAAELMLFHADISKGLLMCADELEEVLAALPSVGRAWAPIATAPQDGTEILVWTKGRMETQSFCHIACFGESSGWTGWTSVDGFPTLPTHWMPLPDPPVRAARGGEPPTPPTE